MANRSFSTVVDTYFKLFSYGEQQLNNPVNENAKLIVVIPSFNEPQLFQSLDSIKQCVLPEGVAVEVIVVLNHGENSSQEVKAFHRETEVQLQEYAQNNNNEQLQYLVIKAFDLPRKHAGVGLARKIGMDEALRRFKQIGYDGVIACFDADSLCESNYIETLYYYFDKQPKTTGVSIYFEHPLQGETYSKEVYEAIIDYELHLRYYKNALSYVGVPFAYHTIGSSMAVRCNAYAKQGGMNKRKAGEDFYFLSKIIQLGNFSEVNATKVIPSPRVSDRVPFGTGKAIGDILEQEEKYFKTYSFDAFIDLKQFYEQAKIACTEDNYFQLPLSLQKFITQNDYEKRIKEIRANTAGKTAFLQRFFFVFDAFWILKFVHFYRDNIKANNDLNKECNRLLQKIEKVKTIENNLELLLRMRKIDREG